MTMMAGSEQTSKWPRKTREKVKFMTVCGENKFLMVLSVSVLSEVYRVGRRRVS